MTPRLLETIESLRAELGRWRRSATRIALVPTMGNLHAGHLALVECARAHADRVLTSIFVNPTQFGPNEDFERYPRTLAADYAALTGAGCDAVFVPTVAAMYPADAPGLTRIAVPSLAGILCGAHRPGHFDGVAWVVTKLFNLVQPDVAVFGEKDFQQLAVIRALVRDLSYPIEVIGVPTVRDADGLALSSRNQYLSPAERRLAPRLYAELQHVAKKLQAGVAVAEAEGAAVTALEALGFAVDYVAVRDAETLAEPAEPRGSWVILAAARLGRTRLIDNLRVNVNRV